MRPVRVVLLALALAAMLTAPPAQAIPAGGASPDTKGTSASVSTRTLSPGDTIRFSVSGFPAGETVSIKIDDQQFCSKLVSYGACVVHQQTIGGNGVASGSFVLPADIPTGRHWLRFLASKDVDGKITPYSCRGRSDFTVVAGTASKGAGSSGPAAGAPTTADAPAAPDVVPAGKVLVVEPSGSAGAAPADGASAAGSTGPTAEPSSVPSTAAEPATPAAEGTPSAAASGRTATGASPQTVAETPSERRFPLVGTVGLAALLAAAAGLLLRSRRRA